LTHVAGAFGWRALAYVLAIKNADIRHLVMRKFTHHKEFACSIRAVIQTILFSRSKVISSKLKAEFALETTEGHPITLSVGYGWSEYAGEGGLNVHWNFLRNEVKKAANEVVKRAANRSGTQSPCRRLRVSVNRLRGRHATTLLGGILRKIERSDILFFDISENNPNVQFELGYAIAKKGQDSGRVYIFSKKGTVPCSDLTGCMFSQYQPSNNSGKSKDNKVGPLELVDPRGFRAALVSSLIEVAKERGMWSLSKSTLEVE